MDTPLDLDQLTQQTKRREFSDGLRDLHIGLTILTLSLLSWFFLSPPGLRLFIKAISFDRSLTVVGFLGLVGAILLLLFGTERAMERIRRASLWKDSGFVKPLRWGFSKWFSVLSTTVVIALIVASTWLMVKGVLSQETALRSIAASASLGTAVLYFGMGYSLKLQRYLVVGSAGVLLSAAIFFYPFTFAQTWLCLGIGWTILLLASGTWALRLALSELKKESVDE